MLRHGALAVLVLVLVPATVQAFDHHHHHHSSSGGSGCGGPHDVDSPDAPDAPVPSPSAAHARIFVTSATHRGDVGGLAGADAACQAAAASRSMPGVFRAWLSDGVTSAHDRVADGGPWYTTADELAFATADDLRAAPAAALLDEYGGYPASSGGAAAWSGSDATGTATRADCGAWTRGTSDASGTTGTTGALDPAWGGGGAAVACDAQLAIVCIQQ